MHTNNFLNCMYLVININMYYLHLLFCLDEFWDASAESVKNGPEMTCITYWLKKNI